MEKLWKNRKLSIVIVSIMFFSIVLSPVPITQAAEEEFNIIVDASSQYYLGEVATITVQTFRGGKITPVDRIDGVIIRPDGGEDPITISPIKVGLGNIYRATYPIPHLEGDYLIVVTTTCQGIEAYGLTRFRAIEVFGPENEIVHDIQHMHLDIHEIGKTLSMLLTAVLVIVVLSAVAVVLLVLRWRTQGKPSE